MVNNLFLDDKDYHLLQSIFSHICPNAVIWAYGSRTKPGEAHGGSDLDLALITLGENALPLPILYAALTESSLTFRVDLHRFERLPLNVQEEIKQHYVVFYEPKPVASVRT